jgi:hypothetical protein
MSVERIEISLIQGSEEMSPRPYPANRDLPDWFKSMPTEVEAGDNTVRTVKNCPPFLEAMTCGYIIPLGADITVGLDSSGGLHGKAEPAHFLNIHQPNAVQGAPFEKCPVLKIFNPWLIRTPPGYSTLFLPPLNRFQMPLVPLAGLVETDTFYREVNFPAVLTIERGTTLTLPRGTPFVQVIPIKRGEFQTEFVPLEVQKYQAMNESTKPIPENINFYKDNFWRKKTYR